MDSAQVRVPVGSPYGFSDEDWKIIASRRANRHDFHVVMGYQFVSEHYDSEALIANVKRLFDIIVADYNNLPNTPRVAPKFRALHAGPGGHLFNEIARDILSADIAVFETSDLNPNVMIELGVALTWGVRCVG